MSVTPGLRLLLVLPVLCFCGIAVADYSEILLHDDFGQLRVGMFSVFVKAHTEYHYRPDAAPKGNWAVSTQEGETGSQRAWWILREGDANLMAQTYDNPDVHTHPEVIAGHELWGDYRLTVTFAPDSIEKQSGVMFRSE